MNQSKFRTVLSLLAFGTLPFAMTGVGCVVEQSDEESLEDELEEVATSEDELKVSVPKSTKFVVPKGLYSVQTGTVVLSLNNDSREAGENQGQSCPFIGATKTNSTDTACGYNSERQWVCCDASCDYTCTFNPMSNRQYWNTDSCSVIESTCAVRAGGPGGAGFDIIEVQTSP